MYKIIIGIVVVILLVALPLDETMAGRGGGGFGGGGFGGGGWPAAEDSAAADLIAGQAAWTGLHLPTRRRLARPAPAAISPAQM